MNFDDIIRLWHKTQTGHIDECRRNQEIFAGIMWNLYEKLKEKENE
jgi:hypothetical protein